MEGRPRARGLAGLLAGVMAAGALTIASATPALAHAKLKSITPKDGSVQTTMPPEVVLTFNEDVNRRYTEIKITGPGDDAIGSGEPRVDGPKVRQPLARTPKPGRYVVAYRTVSVDGHVISGSRDFTYRPAPSAAQGASAPADGTAARQREGAEQASGESSQAPARSSWVLVLLVAVVAVLVTGAVLAMRRGRSDG